MVLLEHLARCNLCTGISKTKYDGGTFMECRIDPKLRYMDLLAMIRLQSQTCVSTLNLFMDD